MSSIFLNMDNELKDLEKEITQIVKEFQALHTSISEEIKAILREAGVFDRIHTLELHREEVRRKSEEAITRLREKAEDLTKVESYLENIPPHIKY